MLNREKGQKEERCLLLGLYISADTSPFILGFVSAGGTGELASKIMLKTKGLVSENVHCFFFILSSYRAALGLRGSVTVSLKYSAAVLTSLSLAGSTAESQHKRKNNAAVFNVNRRIFYP